MLAVMKSVVSENTTKQPILNFVLSGQLRCGASVVQTSIDAHPAAKCHVNLLHRDDRIRRKSHEEYFGEPPNPKTPDWCALGTDQANPESYLTTRVFARPKYHEQAVGVQLLYSDLDSNHLWEFLQEQCRDGSFCLIHVIRNPLACFVSKRQAECTGVWRQNVNDTKTLLTPWPVELDLDYLVPFVRWHEAHRERVSACCDDRLEIRYQELFLDYRGVMAQVFSFLDLSPFPQVASGVKRLKNRRMQDRISNFDEARRRSPSDVRAYFDSADLF